MLFWRALLTESGLEISASASALQSLLKSAYQVHASMQCIRTSLTYKVICSYEIVLSPLMLGLQLLQSLPPSQCPLELIYPTIKVILGFVEDLLRL